MRIFINPVCDYGKGLRKWKKLESELRHRYGKFRVEQIHSLVSFTGQVQRAWDEGERVFIAAGGDGTFNLLLNSLLTFSPDKREFYIGAIGLGSSNDFHKPFRKEAMVRGIPARLEWKDAIKTDVIQISYKNGGNKLTSRFGLINASVGITAQANALYNSRCSFISLMKKISQDAAVIACALNTIFTYSNIPCTLTLDKNSRFSTHLTNLGVIKSPHFAGGLCYDMKVGPGDGNLGVNIGTNMSKYEAVRTLARLYRKKFSGYLKTQSLWAKRVLIESSSSFALEIDGEVVSATYADFRIIPQAVWCCR
jgi:diacylglycerol kinase (ATP)